ncbi:MAG: hypothetical protein HYT38_00615 [Candidatus Sungbacteria bacterium]|uniref:Uncharacterized protein n=1 Tax=Candidatus Sungiibacteriota bacterium TaxID=2750080 RepID=A0A931YD87_9BACT|nr:hypothetical protein [Candidatus Sungbacteria bacterium]MBI2465799.1 hypothetical protein [Candidatus Sungbacteria bacterium]
MSTLLLNAIFVWIVLFIILKIIKQKDVIKSSRFYISVIVIAVTTYVLQVILLLLYVKIFGQFNPVNDFVVDKIAMVGSLSLLVTTFLALLLINKLRTRQALIVGIAVGLFANYTNYILLVYLILSLLGVRLFGF